MLTGIIIIDGFCVNEKFIPRELCITFSNLQQRVYYFTPPIPYSRLSDKDKRTTKYLQRHYHGLPWTPGPTEFPVFPCSDFQKILRQQRGIFAINENRFLINQMNLLNKPYVIMKNIPKTSCSVCYSSIHYYNRFVMCARDRCYM